MADDPDRSQLEALAERIRKARESASGSRSPSPENGGNSNSTGALRIGSDFLATVLASAGLGWLIDQALGTAPWLMLGLLLAGFAVAVMNMARALGKKTEGGRGNDDKRNV